VRRLFYPDGLRAYLAMCGAALLGGLLSVAWMYALFAVLDWVLP
jgi:hypothetical protein